MSEESNATHLQSVTGSRTKNSLKAYHSRGKVLSSMNKEVPNETPIVLVYTVPNLAMPQEVCKENKEITIRDALFTFSW